MMKLRKALYNDILCALNDSLGEGCWNRDGSGESLESIESCTINDILDRIISRYEDMSILNLLLLIRTEKMDVSDG